MRATISLDNGVDDAAFIGWAPMGATVRLDPEDDIDRSVTLTLRNRNREPVAGGRLRFYDKYAGEGTVELSVTVAPTTRSVDLFVGGDYPHASSDAGDAVIEIVDENGDLVGSLGLMVRIRKDADKLSNPERDRILAAFGTLNDSGHGLFATFRDIHRNRAVNEAHGLPAFLPWHRCLLLDIERELQKLDPRVALPYWRFDQPAPKLFTRDFLGAAGPNGRIVFTDANPLANWVTDGQLGLERRPYFDPRTSGAKAQDGSPARSQEHTIALGEVYASFVHLMELDPHGVAHASFSGSIGIINTAARDPLFFFLHANVDRLWATWQLVRHGFHAEVDTAYSPQGHGRRTSDALPPPLPNDRIGHCVNDTMWPWDGDKTAPRPDTAPGGGLAVSVMTTAPGPSPSVADMIDYQGVHSPASRLGFDYDDVPFKFA